MKILIVDDEQTARYGIRKALDVRARVSEAETLTAARKICLDEEPEIVLLDLNLDGESGLDLLEQVQAQGSPPKVIIITAHGSEKVAVEAMKRGAFDYLAKPFDIDELRLIVRNAAAQVELEQENQSLRAELAASSGYGELVGSSPEMRKVYSLIDRVAQTDITVLIAGESGSGKELVAREIHRRSPRSSRPLVTVNCAAVPETLIESELFGHEKGAFTGATQRRLGKFEQARGGTLLLDEIGDMPLETQAKLLRVLEDGTFQRLGGENQLQADVRILSATHRDLRQMVEEKAFREDLYYRLEVVCIEIPPLRRRREDLPPLIHYFKDVFARKHRRRIEGIEPAALSRLVSYPYPGNVRQLRNLMERLVVLNTAGAICEGDLPPEIRHYLPTSAGADSGMHLEPLLQMDFGSARQAFETRYLLAKLREHANNITRTAGAIGIHRQSLQQRIRELGLRNLMEE